MILADTSAWVRHFRGDTTGLASLLHGGQVVMHPWIRLEVALGTPPHRRETLALMARLEPLPVATDAELDGFIARHALHDRGIGLVDAALMASVLLRPGTRLWTFDRDLEAVAVGFGCGYDAPTP
jgi:predicted nucleic acid-binding protein